MNLHPDFLTIPLAHRGLHDRNMGKPENSPAAFQAAVSAEYGIELDLQVSADGKAMVFHDKTLDRLTCENGPVNMRTAAELSEIKLRDGADYIPTLDEVLSAVDGSVPLLIEIKDQDGALGGNTGFLERATAKALRRYKGPVAVQSFNPFSIAAFAAAAPETTVGLVTCDFNAGGWKRVPENRRNELAALPDLYNGQTSFISHDRSDLASIHVARARREGFPILCWTIRSSEEERAARKFADNITFEEYLP